MTGLDFANRLLGNIQTSRQLRSEIPYLDLLKDLAEGGMPISTQMLNSSSNFGSFDRALAEVLNILHLQNSSFSAAPDRLPLPLSAISENLDSNRALLAGILEQQTEAAAANPVVSPVLLSLLDTINAASV